MSFLSLTFALFLTIVCIIYYLFPKRYRWTVLLVASYYFYFQYDWRLSIFLIITTITVYLSACSFDYINQNQKDIFLEKSEEWLNENKKKYQQKFKIQKRWLLTLCLIFNFGILVFFKYYMLLSFIIDPFLSGIGLLGLKLLIPLGISYYTFQVSGYLIDCFYGKVQAEKNIFKLALFTSFFPQLIQGPISRFEQLQPQLIQGNKLKYSHIRDGVILMIWGAFKMICISVPCMVVFNSLTGQGMLGGIDIIIAMIAFSLYVYTSFSGGIDITRGAAQLFGIDMTENFRRPFFATGVGDFWRRWHITLGAWMRDYVFYPISLSKRFNKINKTFRKRWNNNFGKIMPTCFVMFFVFFLVGMWHGIELKYVFYGLYMGIFVSAGIFMQDPLRKSGKKHPNLTKKNKFIYVLAVLATFVIILFGRFIIAAPNISVSFQWFIKLFDVSGGKDFIRACIQILWVNNKWTSTWFLRAGITLFQARTLIISCACLFIVSLMQERGIKIREYITKKSALLRLGIYIFVLFMIVLCVEWEGGKEIVFFYEQY